MEFIDKTEYLEKILGKQKYTVDYYQREYRWGTKQIEQLIDDLYNAFSQFYDDNMDDLDAIDNFGYYYMGSIITTRGENRQIIDGQQRLTSLTLLLIYLKNALEKVGLKNESIDDLIYSPKHNKKSFNIAVEDRRECMENLYNDDVNFTPAKESSQTMLDRYKDIIDLFPNMTDNELLFFSAFVIEKVLLLEIIAPSIEDAQTIFVTMNDRGLSLNSAEMLKAYILQKINESDRYDANKKWQDIIALIKSSSDSDKSGTVNSEDVAFISTWLRAKYAQTLRSTKKGSVDQDYELLGEKFHEWVRNNDKIKMGLKKSCDFKDFVMKEMDLMSRIYLDIKKYSKTLTKGFEEVFYNANRNLNYQMMLIMSAINVSDTQDDINKKIKIISTYVDIYASTKILNQSKPNFNTNKKPLFRVMNLIRNKDVKEVAIILYKSVLSMDKKLDAVENYALTNFTKTYMLHMLARFLTHIDLKMDRENQFNIYMTKTKKMGYDIEHALPDDYPTYASLFDNEKEFYDYRASVGNLLILTLDKNRSYQDMPYKEKREHYLTDNVLCQAMNEKGYENSPRLKMLASEYDIKPYEILDKAAITQRCEMYKNIAYDIWNPEKFKEIVGGWTEQEEQEVDIESDNVITSWIVPCNLSKFPLHDLFNQTKQVYWSANNNFKVNDYIYFYLTLPQGEIKYKCRVLKTNIVYTDIDPVIIENSIYQNFLDEDKELGNYNLFELEYVYPEQSITHQMMVDAGCTYNIQTPVRVTDEINSLIIKAEK